MQAKYSTLVPANQEEDTSGQELVETSQVAKYLRYWAHRALFHLNFLAQIKEVVHHNIVEWINVVNLWSVFNIQKRKLYIRLHYLQNVVLESYLMFNELKAPMLKFLSVYVVSG